LNEEKCQHVTELKNFFARSNISNTVKKYKKDKAKNDVGVEC